MLGKKYLVILKRRFEAGGFLPLFILMIAVQGTVLVSQSLSTLILDPAEIGTIRTFESVVSVLVIVAGFGAPTLAMRDTAAAGVEHRGEAIRNLLILPLIGVTIVAMLLLATLALDLAFMRPLKELVVFALFLILSINITRLVSAISQGLMIVPRIYIVVFIGSLLAIAAHIVGASQKTLVSWISGRLIGELILASSILAASIKYWPEIQWTRKFQILPLLKTAARATLVNFSLIFRMAADAAPIVLLGIYGAVSDDIGNFGVATLILTFATLPVTIMTQNGLPQIVSAAGARQQDLIDVLKRRLLFGSIIIATVMIAGISLLRFAIDSQYDDAFLAAMVLTATLPLKSYVIFSGTILLAYNRYALALITNFLELVLIVLIFPVLGAQVDIVTAVIAVISGASLSSFVLLLFRNNVRKRWP